jgi:hypothetical protein
MYIGKPCGGMSRVIARGDFPFAFLPFYTAT